MSFRDQKHINYVRDELSSNARRASVMIGSGFSKNALPVNPSVGELPLWQELAAQMYPKLHPVGSNVGCTRSSHDGSMDPLRMAQEYDDEFGRSGLHLFLEQHVRDQDFNPGELHVRLLNLRWRDIFTTNWDTLLERTQLHVSHERYNVVNSEDEIPIIDQPRIVKLHGSLGGHYPLIATENDYLLYPKKHAAFVNTVQQAMMETALILIGFSGSDPNFLRWSHWVRDNLGDAAPKIFIAGWLDLSDSEREELRRRNVNAIDLARHPNASNWAEDLHHKYATEWILRSLEAGRPYDVTNWPEPETESNKGHTPISQTRRNREIKRTQI